MMVTWALFSCQGDIWNLAKQNEHITDHLNGGSVFVLLLIGGEYRDRTGDLLHAMQALSRTTRLHTPHKAVGIDDDLRCNGKKPRLQKMYGKTFTACINIYTDINNKQPMETMSCLLPIEMFQQMMMKEKK